VADLHELQAAALSNRYRIERELGAGGMATVYLAEDLKHNRSVAMKVLRPELAAALGPERFLREIAITARLDHPHILPLLDSGEAGGFLFYVMPFVEGESLRDRLNREKQLPMDDAVQIAREVADALDFAHRHDVLHRDIKPENIMLGAGHARVADFGIARAINAAGGDRLTETGLAVGTPEYMSPEQGAGGRDLDGRSDIYALGCVLYEMLAGQPPFGGASVESVVRQHLVAEAKSVTDLRPAVPVKMARALDQAMAKTPADRFPTAARFAEAMTGAIREEAPAVPAIVKSRRTAPLVAILAAVAVLIAGGLALVLRAPSGGPAPARSTGSMLVVLPFENLGAAEDDYFADGITDAITARLASVGGLGVISRTSAVQYRNTDKSPQQIAQELGVDYILEGTIQRERPSDPTSRVRIIPQLIDASNNTHVWAGTYDDDMTEVFQFESDIAERVATALRGTVLEPERQSLAAKPTENAEAYELYLRARRYGRRRLNTIQVAEQLLQRATELDSTFTLAYVQLFYFNSGAVFFGADPSPERRAKARAAVDQAAALEPDAPDVQQAVGYYYYEIERDYAQAEEHFLRAHRGRPNDASLLTVLGHIWRRQGRVEEALHNYQQARVFNPRSASLPDQIGGTLAMMRRYAEADAYLDTAIALAPDNTEPYWFKASNFLSWRGETDSARATLERMPQGIDPRGLSLVLWATIARLDSAYEEFLSRLSGLPLEEVRFQPLVYPKTMLQADAYLGLGDTVRARVYYDSARTRLEAELANTPDDPRLHSALGLALAGLGRRSDAVREGRRAVDLMPVDRDLQMGNQHRWALLQILIETGEYDEAIDHLRYLLGAPAGALTSQALVEADPMYDPLRSLPRFQSLLAGQASR
jgi:eukaryotic-like serine/threonine-protein kinase